MLSVISSIQRSIKSRVPIISLAISCLYGPLVLAAEDSAAEFIEFNDQPLEQDLILPDWFKLSFLELQADLADAKEAGKWGILLYFGRKDCLFIEHDDSVRYGIDAQKLMSHHYC